MRFFVAIFLLSLPIFSNTWEQRLKHIFPELTANAAKNFTEGRDAFVDIAFIKNILFKNDQHGFLTSIFYNFFMKEGYFKTIDSKKIIEFIKTENAQNKSSLSILNSLYAMAVKDLFTKSPQEINNIFQADPQDIAPYSEDLYELISTSYLDVSKEQLVPSMNRKSSPLKIFNDFAQAIKQDIKSPQEHIPSLSLVAQKLLEFSLSKGLLKEVSWENTLCIRMLIYELVTKQKQENTNLEWFLYFAMRLNLINQFDDFSKTYVVNTSYDLHLFEFDKYLCDNNLRESIGTHAEFKKLYDAFGNHHTKNRCSLKYLISLFPQLFLPFPYELSKDDLLAYSLKEPLHFWPMGFAFGKIIADGNTRYALEYSEHDLQHFHLLNSLSNQVFDITDNPEEAKYFQPKMISMAKSHREQGLKIWRSFGALAHKMCQQEENAFLREIFTFFEILLTRENRYLLMSRILCFYHDDLLLTMINIIKDSIVNPLHFLGLLPKELQDKPPEEIIATLKKAVVTFHHKLSDLPEFEALKKQATDWSNHGFSNFPAVTRALRFDLVAYKNQIQPEKEETINDVRVVTYRIHIPKDFNPANDWCEATTLRHVKGCTKQLFKALKKNQLVILRYIFNDLLFNGEKVKPENPFWIERIYLSRDT